VRLLWLEASGRDALDGLERLDLKAVPPVDHLATQLDASARAIERFLASALAKGRVAGFKGTVTTFLAYLIAHEAHHRGQVGWTLKHAGVPLEPKVAARIWDWST
jgi:uncharacterized damage-inducible protein DinB